MRESGTPHLSWEANLNTDELIKLGMSQVRKTPDIYLENLPRTVIRLTKRHTLKKMKGNMSAI